MLYSYCITLLLFVSSYVLIVCTVPLPPGVNPIAVDKYIYLFEMFRFRIWTEGHHTGHFDYKLEVDMYLHAS